ncbi:MAG: serine hydrolase domain-containing protein [Nitrospinaceae bacterium]|jgi:CubicO group peptidase (beta-lactamase class C family)|nr:serine hydrolase domain-containing protein [Nitrospinaceae bacterium]
MMKVAACVLTFAIALSACGVTRNSAGVELEPGSFEYTKFVLEQLVQKEMNRGLPSVSLSLVKDGEIVWSDAFGYSNVGLRTKATRETIYMTASTIKSVTATALLTLIDQGKCQLDDPVNLYLEDSEVDDRPSGSVTIRSVLNHTSGLSDEIGQSVEAAAYVWERDRPELPTLDEIVSSLKSVEPVGETWRYNNSAYGLAGLLIEKISGKSFEQYVVEHVFVPVGASATTPFSPTPEMAESMAFTYLRMEDGSFVADKQRIGPLYPAGGDSRTTAEDMARFLGAHLNAGKFNGNQILSEELVDESHVPFKGQYGLGWWVWEDDLGHSRIAHGGNWPSAVTAMVGDKTANVGAYVMTNVGQTQATFRIADAAVRLLRGEEVSIDGPEAVELAEDHLRKFAGKYDQADGLRISIEFSEGALKYVYPSFEPFNGIVYTYLAKSDYRFFEPDIGTELLFSENEEGNVDGFQLTQHGFLDYGYARRVSE